MCPQKWNYWLLWKLLIFFLVALHGLWDLSFPTRDWTRVTAVKSAKSQQLDHQGILWKCVLFWGIGLFSTVSAPFYLPTNRAQGFQFLYILASGLLLLTNVVIFTAVRWMGVVCPCVYDNLCTAIEEAHVPPSWRTFPLDVDFWVEGFLHQLFKMLILSCLLTVYGIQIAVPLCVYVCVYI